VAAVVSLKCHDADLASRLRAKSGAAEEFLFASGIADLALCGYYRSPKIAKGTIAPDRENETATFPW
jgi:hypothetical protein